MNKLIDGFFEHKLLVQILSVLTAILIWFIVLDNNNPMMTRNISVPISGNVEVLEEHNLRIVGTAAPFSVNLSIKGRQKSIAEITSNDFRVFLDYNKITTSGDIILNLDDPVYTGTSNLKILSASPATVTLKLERITGVEFPVQASWTGKLPDGYTAVNVRIEPSTIVLEDKESLVNKVEKLVVSIDANALDKTSNLTRRVLVLDAGNQSIPQFDGKSTVSVSFDLVRTLPVETKVTGTPAADWFFTGYSIEPKEVQVLGKYDGLSTLSSVVASDIDLNSQEGSYSADLALKIPEGFTLYGKKPQVLAEVQMEKLIMKELTVPVENILVTGLDSTLYQLRYISTAVQVGIKGKAKEISGILPTAIQLKLDVTAMTEGEQTMELNAAVPSMATLVGVPTVQFAIEPIAPPPAAEETVQP